jgi:hypothetical protein
MNLDAEEVATNTHLTYLVISKTDVDELVALKRSLQVLEIINKC